MPHRPFRQHDVREMPNKNNMTAPRTPQASWYWSAPYFAVLVFSLVMLVLVWILQRQESETQRNALARDVQ